MVYALLLALAALALTAPDAAAAERPRPLLVVELFSSQGCAACVPAKALVGELNGRPDVLALTFPVDHWDYLGWKESWAKPEFNARHRAYARAAGQRGLATPHVVVNGAVAFVGAPAETVRRRLAGAAAPAPGLSLSIRRDGEDAVIEIDRGAWTAPARQVWLIQYEPAPTAARVERGENAGRTIVAYNRVTDLALLGLWSGAPTRFNAKCARACAAIVQNPAGEILAAARLEPEPALTAAPR